MPNRIPKVPPNGAPPPPPSSYPTIAEDPSKLFHHAFVRKQLIDSKIDPSELNATMNTLKQDFNEGFTHVMIGNVTIYFNKYIERLVNGRPKN